MSNQKILMGHASASTFRFVIPGRLRLHRR